jgi:hypothetical protein
MIFIENLLGNVKIFTQQHAITLETGGANCVWLAFYTLLYHSRNPVLIITSEIELDLTFNSLGFPMTSASPPQFHDLFFDPYALLISPIFSTFAASNVLRFIIDG